MYRWTSSFAAKLALDDSSSNVAIWAISFDHEIAKYECDMP